MKYNFHGNEIYNLQTSHFLQDKGYIKTRAKIPQNLKSQIDLQLLSKSMKFWTTVRLRIVVPTTYHT
jgi:hypothetical protein